MKYVSISVITTGPSPIKNDILEFSAIVEDTKHQLSFDDTPKMRLWVDKEFYRGHPAALSAQKPIFDKICELRAKSSKRLIVPDEVTMHFTKFLQPHFSEGAKFKKPINVAGVQFGTNAQRFLNKFPNFINIPIHPNILELGNFFINWEQDKRPPSFLECKKQCGLPETSELDTLHLAWDVILMLRNKYNPNKKHIEAFGDLCTDFNGNAFPQADIQVGGRVTCGMCGKDYDMADIHQCEPSVKINEI